MEADIIESRSASCPEFTSESESTFFPADLTYCPRIILTATMIKRYGAVIRSFRVDNTVYELY